MLKNKLLSTNCFEENEYLNKYCELIENNLTTEFEKFKTCKHHILQKSYFKKFNLPIDNSKENIVNLPYRDHILAHKYLCLCTKDEDLRYANEVAFFTMSKCRKYNQEITEEDLKGLQSQYEEFSQKMSLVFKNNWTNEDFKNSKIQQMQENKYHLGCNHSEDTKNSISLKNKGNNAGIPRPSEVKDKISKSSLGKPKGPRSEETKNKISEAKKGKPLSPEHKQALKGSHKKKEVTQETKDKMSKSKKGKPLNFKDPISRGEKISKSLKGKPKNKKEK